MLHARYRVRVSLHRGVGEEKLACSLLTYPAPAAAVAIAPIPVSRDRGRPTRCNLYFCVQPTRIRGMKRVTKVFRGYFSLCCPAEKEKRPSFDGLEQEAGMKVRLVVPPCSQFFFVNLITSNGGGGGEMDCARNWVGSPSASVRPTTHTHLTKALEIGPGIASPSPVG